MWIFVIMITILLMIPNVVCASTYYVATNGNDSSNGYVLTPWKTIQKAAETMISGDVVIVAPGDYLTQRVNITKSGSSGAPIVYQTQGNVKMKGFNIQADYIIVKGFEILFTDYVRYSTSIGAGIYVNGAFNVIENNYIHDAALEGIVLNGTPQNFIKTHDNVVKNNRLFHNENVGINVNGRNNLIDNNEVWGTVQCHPTVAAVEGPGCPIEGLDADGMRFFGQGHIFRSNKIHSIRIEPPEVNNAHIDCFQTWADAYDEVAQNILFENNFCENLNQGMSVFMLAGGTNHLIIRNNIFKSYSGINTGGGADYLYINNNVFANSLAFNTGNAIGLENVLHVEINSNIFYDQAYHTISISGNTDNFNISNNLAFNSNGIIPQCIKVTGNNNCLFTASNQLWGVNPLFVDLLSDDYHLQSDSPACNGGIGGIYIGAYPCEKSNVIVLGDSNNDGRVDLIDFVNWKKEYLGQLNTKRADFDKNMTVDLVDYMVWRRGYFE